MRRELTEHELLAIDLLGASETKFVTPKLLESVSAKLEAGDYQGVLTEADISQSVLGFYLPPEKFAEYLENKDS